MSWFYRRTEERTRWCRSVIDKLTTMTRQKSVKDSLLQHLPYIVSQLVFLHFAGFFIFRSAVGCEFRGRIRVL